METHAFLLKHPTLWHMTYAESWPSIQQLGLLTAEQLVMRSAVPAPERVALLTTVRPERVRLELPDVGTAVLRDQCPLDVERLAGVLDGMDVVEWLQLLNRHVFFFPSETAMLALRNASSYVDEPCVTLQLRSSSLLESYGSLVRVTSINTGNTRPPGVPARRGPTTFRSVKDHTRVVKEVAVPYGVPDLLDHLVRADLDVPGQPAQQLV